MARLAAAYDATQAMNQANRIKVRRVPLGGERSPSFFGEFPFDSPARAENGVNP